MAFQADNPHSFNRYAYANNNPYKYVDPDGRLGFHWHFIITYNAARDSGRGIGDSLKLAWGSMAADWRDNSQRKEAEYTRLHAMAGKNQEGKYDSPERAINNAKAFIGESIAGGDLAGAVHASEDLATPGHAGKEWRGFKYTAFPSLENLLNAQAWKESQGRYMETLQHLWGDTFPTSDVRRSAHENALKAIRRYDAKQNGGAN